MPLDQLGWAWTVSTGDGLERTMVSVTLRESNGGFHTPEGREILVPLLAQRLIEGVRQAPKLSEAAKRISYAERHSFAPTAPRLGSVVAR